MTPGERLKARREEVSMSQSHLSGLSGVATGYISKIETGERAMTPASSLLLALPLGVTPLWLLEGGHGGFCPFCLKGE